MPYRLVEKQVIYDGKKISLELHQIEDEHGRRFEREICVHPGAVVILPILDEHSVLLIRNYRYTVGKTLIELPAGTLENGEDPAECAHRELLEETGYVAGRLQRLPDFYASPGILTEKMRIFAAYDLVQSTAALEPGEQIELLPVRYTEALEMIRDGQIEDGKTIATLLMFDRFFRSPAP